MPSLMDWVDAECHQIVKYHTRARSKGISNGYKYYYRARLRGTPSRARALARPSPRERTHEEDRDSEIPGRLA